MKNTTIFLFAVLGGLILAGCGGGGVSAAPNTETPQARALNIAPDIRPIVAAFGAARQIDIPAENGLVTVVLTDEEYGVLQKVINDYRNQQLKNGGGKIIIEVPPPDNSPSEPSEPATVVITLDTPDTGGTCAPGFIFMNGLCIQQDGFVPPPMGAPVVRTDTPYARAFRSCGNLENGKIYARDNTLGGSILSNLHPSVPPRGTIVDFYFEARDNARIPNVFGGNVGNNEGKALIIRQNLHENGASQFIRPHGNSPLAGVANPEGFQIIVREINGNYDRDFPLQIQSTLRIFKQGGEYFLAHDLGISCDGAAYAPLHEGAFAFPENMFEIPAGITVFSLREELRGHMDESAAVRLENFFFVSDSEMRDVHLEYRATPFENENFALHADGGFRRWGQNNTNTAYMKITGMRALSPRADIYAQASMGEVRSDFWKNGELRGFAAGIFYENLLRRGDSYHLRIEQPFAAKELARWRIAADARFGGKNRYLRFNFWRNMQNGKQGARMFLTREF